MICYKKTKFFLYSTKINHLDQTVIFSMHTLSSSYKTSHQEFHWFHLFHSLHAALFGREGPGLQFLLWCHSFHWYQEFLEVPWVQSFLGCPCHLWLRPGHHGHHGHHDLVPRNPRLAVHTRNTTRTERRLLYWNEKNVIQFNQSIYLTWSVRLAKKLVYRYATKKLKKKKKQKKKIIRALWRYINLWVIQDILKCLINHVFICVLTAAQIERYHGYLMPMQEIIRNLLVRISVNFLLVTKNYFHSSGLKF